jgi:hypothetical protein
LKRPQRRKRARNGPLSKHRGHADDEIGKRHWLRRRSTPSKLRVQVTGDRARLVRDGERTPSIVGETRHGRHRPADENEIQNDPSSTSCGSTVAVPDDESPPNAQSPKKGPCQRCGPTCSSKARNSYDPFAPGRAVLDQGATIATSATTTIGRIAATAAEGLQRSETRSSASAGALWRRRARPHDAVRRRRTPVASATTPIHPIWTSPLIRRQTRRPSRRTSRTSAAQLAVFRRWPTRSPTIANDTGNSSAAPAIKPIHTTPNDAFEAKRSTTTGSDPSDWWCTGSRPDLFRRFAGSRSQVPICSLSSDGRSCCCSLTGAILRPTRIHCGPGSTRKNDTIYVHCYR